MSSAPFSVRSTSPAPPSSGLYVPVHKRSSSVTSTDDSISSMSSSRPSSRAESRTCFSHLSFLLHCILTDLLVTELSAEHSEAGHRHSLVYSRDRLMALAKSALATMPKDVKDELRERLPEVVMSRKHRKAMEYRASLEQRAQKSLAQAQAQHTREPMQAQQVKSTAHTGSKNIESVQQQHSHMGAALHHQPARAPHQSQRQSHIHGHPQAQGQTAVVQHPVLGKAHPAGRAWWGTTKPTTDNMGWRRQTSISVV